MKRWMEEDIVLARKMRCEGSTFGEIIKKLGVSKSTLGYWLKDTPKPNLPIYTNRIEWLAQIRKLAVKANKKKRADRLADFSDIAGREIKLWTTIRDINVKKAILGMLYWAEGSKGKCLLQFANTDPRLIKLFIVLLRQCFEIDESKLRLRLHLHDDHDEEKVKKFWSKITNIPLSQFNKTYRKEKGKKRKFRSNIGGICFIKYNSVYLQERIMAYAWAVANEFTGELAPIV